MEKLKDGVDLEQFFARLGRASRRILFLDYDGTLAPFQVNPAEAVPYQGIPELLNAIMENGCNRLVVVSGRRPHDLVPLLALPRCPEIWGSHGRERLWPDRRYEVMEMPEGVRRNFQEATRRIESQGLEGWLEEKPGCLALHFRGKDPSRVRAIRLQAEKEWAAIADRSQLSLREFDGGIELRVPDRDKGDVVLAVLSEEEPGWVAAYLGDDLTDEDGFRTIQGRGLSVLVRPEFRSTAADLWLRPPEELIAFLNHWRE